MSTASALRAKKNAWRWEFVVAALACAVLLACGGEVSIGSTPPPPPAEGGASRSDALVAAPQHDSSVPPPPADQGIVPDQQSRAADATEAQCPSAEVIAGSYAGTFSGSLQALIQIPLSGTITFDVLPGSGTTRLMKNGKVHVVVLGLTFDLTMEGEVACGKLVGQGGATIAGVQFSGAFLGQWQAGDFPTGTWNGQDVNSTKGSGSWTATHK